MSVLTDLPQIGSDGGLHQIGEKAQDAVLVERGDRFELLFDFSEDARLACGALGIGGGEARVEASLKQGERGLVLVLVNLQ